jgi:hypothetical protein
VSFGDGPFVVTHPRINCGVPLVGRLCGTFTTRILGRGEIEVVRVDAYLELPETVVELEGWDAPWPTPRLYLPIGLAEVSVPTDHKGDFPNPNRGRVDGKTRNFRTTMGLVIELPSVPPGSVPWASAVLSTTGIMASDNTVFSVGSGLIISSWLAGAFFCCAHGKTPAPAQPAPPTPAPPLPPPRPDTVAPVDSNWPFTSRPLEPKKIEQGTAIDGWLVLHECETSISQNCMTGQNNRIYNIKCTGCSDDCVLVRYRKPFIKGGPLDGKWSLYISDGKVVKVGAGGVSVQELGEQEYWYRCVCATYD